MSAGSTVKGEQVSATIAIATVVQTLFWRSWTLRLFNKVTKTSCGPIALAMYPNVLTVALRIPFLCAFNISSSSKQILIHSRAGTYSAPLSAILPTRSCTLVQNLAILQCNRCYLGSFKYRAREQSFLYAPEGHTTLLGGCPDSRLFLHCLLCSLCQNKAIMQEV